MAGRDRARADGQGVGRRRDPVGQVHRSRREQERPLAVPGAGLGQLVDDKELADGHSEPGQHRVEPERERHVRSPHVSCRHDERCREIDRIDAEVTGDGGDVQIPEGRRGSSHFSSPGERRAGNSVADATRCHHGQNPNRNSSTSPGSTATSCAAMQAKNSSSGTASPPPTSMGRPWPSRHRARSTSTPRVTIPRCSPEADTVVVVAESVVEAILVLPMWRNPSHCVVACVLRP